MKYCPFQKPDYMPEVQRNQRCDPECALWVESEKMCSLRLLADDIVDHRQRVRNAGMTAGPEYIEQDQNKEKP